METKQDWLGFSKNLPLGWKLGTLKGILIQWMIYLRLSKTISPDLSDFGSLTLPFRKPSRICRIEERGGGAIWLLMQFPKGLETGACLQPPLLEMHLDQNGSRQKLKADKAGIAVATINLEIH